MILEIPKEEIINHCRELEAQTSERARLVGVEVERVMRTYMSPFYEPRESDTGEGLYVPLSIKFGAAVRYCEIDIDPEVEPTQNPIFCDLLSTANEFWVSLGLNPSELTPSGLWWQNILPNSMVAGYRMIGISRQKPSLRP
jgi:hypothetical protein